MILLAFVVLIPKANYMQSSFSLQLYALIKQNKEMCHVKVAIVCHFINSIWYTYM